MLKNVLSGSYVSPKAALKFLIIVVIGLGIFFRFASIDQKVYWGDEVHTSLRVSGYTYAEMEQQLRSGNVIGVPDVLKFQYPSPEKSAADTVQGLAREDSQQMPLYFVLTRYWVSMFGDSIAVTRLFSAVTSLLAFPCLYWLCLELFSSAVVGWVAIALMAVSPTHILYAQEARGYTLWIVLILASSAALLRAIRLGTKLSWATYALLLSISLYTHLYSVLVIAAHGIYVLAHNRLRLNRTLLSYVGATLIGILVFLPQAMTLVFNRKAIDGPNWATATAYSPVSVISRWAGIISRTFLDLGFGLSDSWSSLLVMAPVVLLVVVLAVYSLFFLFRQTKEKTWLFVLTLLVTTSLVLFVPDLIFGWHLGTTRYLLPGIISLQISIAYLFTAKLFPHIIHVASEIRWKHLWGWRALCGLILSMGVVSGIVSYPAQIWWSKAPWINEMAPEVAEVVNQADSSLIISDSGLLPVVTLTHLLDSEEKLQLFMENSVPKEVADFSYVFLFRASEEFKSSVEKLYGVQSSQVNDVLWHLKK